MVVRSRSGWWDLYRPPSCGSPWLLTWWPSYLILWSWCNPSRDLGEEISIIWSQSNGPSWSEVHSYFYFIFVTNWAYNSIGFDFVAIQNHHNCCHTPICALCLLWVSLIGLKLYRHTLSQSFLYPISALLISYLIFLSFFLYFVKSFLD